MAQYIIEESNYKRYEKNYFIPFFNLIPGLVWSIPFRQKLFPEATGWTEIGITFGFMLVYVILSFIPIISLLPCISGGIMGVAMFWIFPNHITNAPVRVILKIVILAFFVMLELCILINATLPWLEKKFPNKPNIRVVK